MSKICKRCMKKQVTEDGKPYVVATLEAVIGKCSYCETENWVHSVPAIAGIEDMPELGVEKTLLLTPKGHGATKAREVPETISVHETLDEIDAKSIPVRITDADIEETIRKAEMGEIPIPSGKTYPYPSEDSDNTVESIPEDETALEKNYEDVEKSAKVIEQVERTTDAFEKALELGGVKLTLEQKAELERLKAELAK